MVVTHRLIATLGAVLALAVGGCAQQSPPTPAAPTTAPPVTGNPSPQQPAILGVEPVKLPEGHELLAAIGNDLVLRTRRAENDTLVLLVGGRQKQEIVTRPYNRMFSFAADDERWLVWSESRTNAGASQQDEWTIWAWDKQTGDSYKVAQADGTAKELGLPPNWEIGPIVRASAGHAAWVSFDRTTAETQLRLHLYDLQARQDRIVATASMDDRTLFGFDIQGDRLAYRQHEVIILETMGQQKESVPVGSEIGPVAVTQAGLVWGEGQRKYFLLNAQGRQELPEATSDRWWLTSSRRYVTWFEADGENVMLLDTVTGQMLVAATGVVQGGQLRNGYLSWWQSSANGPSKTGAAAKLP